jgi:hypothetical protein
VAVSNTSTVTQTMRGVTPGCAVIPDAPEP